MDFTDAEAFNGQLTDSTNLDRKTFTNLYHTMLMSRVRDVNEGFMLPHELANTWEGYRRDNNDLDLKTETIKAVNGIENLTVKNGTEHLMELYFDNSVQEKSFDLRPELPLIIHL